MRREVIIDETTWRSTPYGSDWFMEIFLADYEAYARRPIEDRDQYTFFCMPFMRYDKKGSNETHVIVTARITSRESVKKSFVDAKEEFNAKSHCVQAILTSEHRPLIIHSADVRKLCYLQLTEIFETILPEGCKIRDADLGMAVADKADTPPCIIPRNILKTHIIRGGQVAKLLLSNYVPNF